MKKTTIAAAILALGVVIAAPIAFAQRHMRAEGFGGGMMMFGRMQYVKQQLDLTDGQVTQIQQIFADLRTQNLPYRESMRGGMQSVLQTLLANPNDVQAAQTLLDQQNAAETQMKANALKAASKALSVLSADQRGKLSTIVQEHIARHGAANR